MIRVRVKVEVRVRMRVNRALNPAATVGGASAPTR